MRQEQAIRIHAINRFKHAWHMMSDSLGIL